MAEAWDDSCGEALDATGRQVAPQLLDAAADLPALERPTLVLAGTLDALRPPDAMAEIAARIAATKAASSRRTAASTATLAIRCTSSNEVGTIPRACAPALR